MKKFVELSPEDYNAVSALRASGKPKNGMIGYELLLFTMNQLVEFVGRDNDCDRVAIKSIGEWISYVKPLSPDDGVICFTCDDWDKESEWMRFHRDSGPFAIMVVKPTEIDEKAGTAVLVAGLCKACVRHPNFKTTIINKISDFLNPDMPIICIGMTKQ